MDFSRRVEIPETLFAQEVDGETVLLDMDRESYYGFDAVGSDIWRLLQQRCTIEEVIGELREMYEVDEATLRRDVKAFVERLIDNGLARLD